QRVFIGPQDLVVAPGADEVQRLTGADAGALEHAARPGRVALDVAQAHGVGLAAAGQAQQADGPAIGELAGRARIKNDCTHCFTVRGILCRDPDCMTTSFGTSSITGRMPTAASTESATRSRSRASSGVPA